MTQKLRPEVFYNEFGRNSEWIEGLISMEAKS